MTNARKHALNLKSDLTAINMKLNFYPLLLNLKFRMLPLLAGQCPVFLWWIAMPKQSFTPVRYVMFKTLK
jgi:hypothetical protein